MKLALAILAAVLLLAGCSSTPSAKDPFVGTWQAIGSPPGNGLVIGKAPNAYLGVLTDSYHGVFRYHFLRHGNELRTTMKIPNPPQPAKPFNEVVVLDFDSANGRLTWTEDGQKLIGLTKTSDSTTAPTPSPAATLHGESSTTTYANTAYHYSISYDPKQVVVQTSPQSDNGSLGSWDILGLGFVKERGAAVHIAFLKPSADPTRSASQLDITSLRCDRPLFPPSLAAFGSDSVLKDLAARGLLYPRPSYVKFADSFPTIRYGYRVAGGLKGLTWVVFAGGYVYDLDLLYPAKHGQRQLAKLDAVAKTFTVTP